MSPKSSMLKAKLHLPFALSQIWGDMSSETGHDDPYQDFIISSTPKPLLGGSLASFFSADLLPIALFATRLKDLILIANSRFSVCTTISMFLRFVDGLASEERFA
jgi:hypothetical protein